MIIACAAVATGLGGAGFGLIAGFFLLRGDHPVSLLITWDLLFGAFLFFWAIGLISSIQRSESIDIGKMLHLPVSLKQVFFINYLASHLTFSIVLFVPGMLGLCLGLILRRGWPMLGLPPLVVGSIFMVTAWTYCLRGWLVALMSNPRRRRTVIALMAFVAVMVGQLPNLVNIARGGLSREHRRPAAARSERSSHGGGLRDMPPEALIVHQVVPFLWVGNGAMGMAQGNVSPALWGAAAAFGIGALGLRRAYRSTIRFYQGYDKGKGTSAKPAQQAVRRSGVILVERRLPGIPEEASAMAFATLRSLMRAPEVKMALALNVLFLVMFGATPLLTRSHPLDDVLKPFVATGTTLFMCLTLIQLLSNQFGYDRAGFRPWCCALLHDGGFCSARTSPWCRSSWASA